MAEKVAPNSTMFFQQKDKKQLPYWEKCLNEHCYQNQTNKEKK